MLKCKITVLKNDVVFGDLIEKYHLDRPLSPCEYMKPGDEFWTDGYQKPEGFCSALWDAVGKLGAMLASGGKVYGKYTNAACCNDGIRTVIVLA